MATTRLDLEYVGTRFAGWARQPGQRTVQGEIERVLAIVLPEPVALTVAGRTDRGVHAWGQVASYPGPAASVRSLNALLDDDVAVLASAAAPDGFDARGDARSRTYCYRVLRRGERSAFERGRALWWPHRLDASALLGVCRPARRDPRLHGVHADRDRPRAVLTRRVRGASGRSTATSSSSGSRPTRSCAT